MNTNLPLVLQTSDGPTWSNGWAATGAHLDMIAKQYRNRTRTGKERGKNGKKGGKKGVGMGSKMGFKRQKNGISPNSTIWNGEERPFFAVPHISCRFWAVPPRFLPVFHDFDQKREKTGAQKWRNGKGKNAFLSRFFPVPVFSRSFPGTCLTCTVLLTGDIAAPCVTPKSGILLYIIPQPSAWEHEGDAKIVWCSDIFCSVCGTALLHPPSRCRS